MLRLTMCTKESWEGIIKQMIKDVMSTGMNIYRCTNKEKNEERQKLFKEHVGTGKLEVKEEVEKATGETLLCKMLKKGKKEIERKRWKREMKEYDEERKRELERKRKKRRRERREMEAIPKEELTQEALEEEYPFLRQFRREERIRRYLESDDEEDVV